MTPIEGQHFIFLPLMRRMYRPIVFVFFVVSTSLLLMSCDDELDTDGLAPFFRLEFINQTLSNSIEPIVADLNEQIDLIDSSIVILDSITNSEDPRDFTDSISQLNETRSLLIDERTENQDILDDIDEGLVLINSVAVFGGDSVLTFEDSLSSYAFQLNPNTNSSFYRISLGGTIYDLEAEYTRNTVVRERSVRVEALNFKIIDEGTSFIDFAVNNSDTINFSSNEATVTLFF